MVIARRSIVDREMKRRGLSAAGLASAMGVREQTVINLLGGQGIHHSTQVALFNAFGGLIPFTKLFEVSEKPVDNKAEREEAVA